MVVEIYFLSTRLFLLYIFSFFAFRILARVRGWLCGSFFFFFLTAIWLPIGQLQATAEVTARENEKGKTKRRAKMV